MDLKPHIERFRKRFAELESLLSDSKIFDNPQAAQELSREYARLKDLVAAGAAYLNTLAQLEENRTLLKTELPDSELALMAKEEIMRLEADDKKLAQQIQFGLVPPDPTDSRNTIVEIRAGAGGSESALFAADLYRMYCRYAEARGWKTQTLDSSVSDLGGFKEIIFQINGADVFKRMKYESGVTASSACRQPRRKAGFTRALAPSPFCPRPRKWTSKSSLTKLKSTAAAHPAKAVRA